MKFFNEVFPDFAELETKIFYLSENRDVLIEWRYIILESYCSNTKCDCLDVFLVVISPDDKVSGFDYSLDTNKLCISDRLWVSVFRGSNSIWADKNSIYTDDIFDILKEKILTDKFYIERLKVHYKMMKYKKDDIIQDNIIFIDDIDDDKKKYNLIEKPKLTRKQEKERNRKKMVKKQKK